MKVKCQNCGFEWEYKGKYKNQTTCPDCQRKTPIKEINNEGQNK